MDWKQEGRDTAHGMRHDQHAVAWWCEDATNEERQRHLRKVHAKLLSAARWGALDGGHETEAHADLRVDEAVGLLCEGFVEGLRAEIDTWGET